MPVSEHAELRVAFCSYCGYPSPSGPDTSGSCSRCETGVVRCAPAGDTPAPDDPFLIVTEDLHVQALSRQAEAILDVWEFAAIGIALHWFLLCDRLDGAALSRLVALAIAGTPWLEPVELRSARDPQIRFRTRISRCGPPPAGLLLLTPMPDRSASTNGRERETPARL